jgi:CRP-like cAMP-binding protein
MCFKCHLWPPTGEKLLALVSLYSSTLRQEFFSAGTVVVRQGDRGDKFYIIRGGTVVVTKRDGDVENRVGSLRRYL